MEKGGHVDATIPQKQDLNHIHSPPSHNTDVIGFGLAVTGSAISNGDTMTWGEMTVSICCIADPEVAESIRNSFTGKLSPSTPCGTR